MNTLDTTLLEETELSRSKAAAYAATFRKLAPPVFTDLAEERRHRKERLAGGFRIFAACGFSEGVAGHITARDPEFTDTFWVNPFGMHFGQIRVSDLIRVDAAGSVVEGDRPVNVAAFAIHAAIHEARPEVVAAAHAHSIYGKAWSAVGRVLDPITQDACAFYEDHVFFDDTRVLITEASEGAELARCLGSHKGAILRNHGLLTVGRERRGGGLVVHLDGALLPGAVPGGVGRDAAAGRHGECPGGAGGQRLGVRRLVPVPAALGPGGQGAAGPTGVGRGAHTWRRRRKALHRGRSGSWGRPGRGCGRRRGRSGGRRPGPRRS